jgi:hypothetical protein
MAQLTVRAAAHRWRLGDPAGREALARVGIRLIGASFVVEVSTPRVPRDISEERRPGPPFHLIKVQGDVAKRGEEPLSVPGEVKYFTARSRWRVGWWEFSARLFKYFD